MRRGITLDETGIALDAQIGWATALPVLALVALGLAAWAAYRRRVRGHDWLARTKAWADARLARWGMGPVPAALVAVGSLVAAVWLALLLVALFGMVWVPVTLALGEPLSEAGELRWYLLTFTALTAALGALVALPFTVLRTWFNARQTDFNARQTETAKQSHITDQINKAVEALGAEKEVSRIGRVLALDTPDGPDTRIEWQGHPVTLAEGESVATVGEWKAIEETVRNTEVRIGGIYALERIAQDSLRDHVQIMEILTAYIRENAPARGLAPLVPALDALPDDAPAEDRAAHVRAVKERAERIEQAAGVLEADTVIQAAIQVIARREPEQKDKEKADTRYGKGGYRLDLRGTDLRAVDISGLDLSRARLTGAHLERAVLDDAHLEGARLSIAHLEGADLGGAHLEGARLVRAHLEGATFTGAVVQYAAVKSSDLSTTILDQDQVNATVGDGSVTDAMLPPGVTRPAHWPQADLALPDFHAEWQKWQSDPDG